VVRRAENDRGPFPPADNEILRDPDVARPLLEADREARVGGVRGIVQEAVILASPWGFEPSDASVPVYIWQGEADRNVPVGMGRRLARDIAGSVARFEPAAGHLFTARRWPEIEAQLLSAWDAALPGAGPGGP